MFVFIYMIRPNLFMQYPLKLQSKPVIQGLRQDLDICTAKYVAKLMSVFFLFLFIIYKEDDLRSLYDILLPGNHTIQRGWPQVIVWYITIRESYYTKRMTSGHCMIHYYQGIILYKEDDLIHNDLMSSLFVKHDSLIIYHTMTWGHPLCIVWFPGSNVSHNDLRSSPFV